MHVFVCCSESRQNHHSGKWPLAATRKVGGQKQAGEGGDEVSKDSCIAQFGPYLHFNKSAEVKCLNSQENYTDVDRLSWGGGSIQIHVDVHLYPCQNLQ